MSAAAVLPRREPIDQLTLRRAQQGDERAWRVLVETHQHAIHALIWRLLAKRSRHRCEDLTQETFVRVLRALPAFDTAGTASLQTWILTIATRLTLNELRRPEPNALPDDLDAPASDRADANAERRRLGEAIAAGVGALPETQRAVFVLREYHELDYSEIATALEIDLGTVKSRLARARAALRDHLAAEMPNLGKRHG